MKKLMITLCCIAIAANVFAQNITIYSPYAGRNASVEGGKTTSNTPIISWEDDCQSDIVWTKVNVAGSSNFKLKNIKSGKFMAVASAGTVNGSKIVIFDDKGQSDILWVTEPASSGHVRIKNVNSGKYLGIEGASKNNGANLVLWENKNQEDINWVFRSLGNLNTSFNYIGNCSNNYYLSVNAEVATEEPPVIMKSAERWIIEKNGNFYKIKNEKTSKYIGIKGASTAAGAEVVCIADRGQEEIQWELIRVTYEGFKLKNKHSGLFLGVEGGSIKAETKVVQWRDEGQKDIIWKKAIYIE